MRFFLGIFLQIFSLPEIFIFIYALFFLYDGV